jgi:hypothetical protein
VPTSFDPGCESGWLAAATGHAITKNAASQGGITDNRLTGAVWVFTRSGGGWTQQGSKLVGTGAVGQGGQGISVALSADGTTAIVGGPYDNSNTGAAWVFARSGGGWTQQGNKLVGTGAVATARQGSSVALSADGNTAIVGGTYDNADTGAAWVFTRSGGVWAQQGSKLVGTGAVATARQGSSVALSADGNTAIVGGATTEDPRDVAANLTSYRSRRSLLSEFGAPARSDLPRFRGRRGDGNPDDVRSQ